MSEPARSAWAGKAIVIAFVLIVIVVAAIAIIRARMGPANEPLRPAVSEPLSPPTTEPLPAPIDNNGQ